MASTPQRHPLQQLAVLEGDPSQNHSSMYECVDDQDKTTEMQSHSSQECSIEVKSPCSYEDVSELKPSFSIGQDSKQFSPEHVDMKGSLHSQLHSAVVKALATSGDCISPSDPLLIGQQGKAQNT